MMSVRLNAIVVGIGGFVFGLVAHAWWPGATALAQGPGISVRHDDTAARMIVESPGRSSRYLVSIETPLDKIDDRVDAAGRFRLPDASYTKAVVYAFQPLKVCEHGACNPCRPGQPADCLYPPPPPDPLPMSRGVDPRKTYIHFFSRRLAEPPTR